MQEHLHFMPIFSIFFQKKKSDFVNLSKSLSAKMEAICFSFLKAKWVLMME